MAIIHGTSGDDIRDGTEFDDQIFGYPATLNPDFEVGYDTLNGLAGDDHLLGGGGHDRLNGGADDDLLEGGAGDDTLNGNDGEDVLDGGAGNDRMFGDAGDDVLRGSLGNDALIGGDGVDTASFAQMTSSVFVDLTQLGPQNAGGAGFDTLQEIENLVGSAFSDNLRGDGGNNVIEGGAGNDSLEGGAGNDTLDGGAGNDSMDGGDGVDTATYASAASGVVVHIGSGSFPSSEWLRNFENLIGSAFDDKLGGNFGVNTVDGGSGNDTLLGEGGDDVLQGGGGIDNLDGGAGDDQMFGGDDNDGFRGSTGADHYDGGAGTGDTVNYMQASSTVIFLDGSGANDAAAAGDTFTGIENIAGSVTGPDLITGDAADNRLVGNGGNDRLTGRAGIDTLEGGAGTDRLIGEQGNDVLTGGADADAFVFNLAPAAGGLDRTNDFAAGIDRIEIDASAFGGGLVAGGAVQLVSGSNPTSAGLTGGVFLYDTDDGFLRFDADGQGAGAAAAFFRLQNLPGLTAADFVVVA